MSRADPNRPPVKGRRGEEEAGEEGNGEEAAGRCGEQAGGAGA